jgi:N-acetyltransferase
MNSSQWFEDVTLEGQDVRLVPLRLEHGDALLQAASDGRLWELWYTMVPGPATMDAYLAQALADRQANRALPFVVLDRATGQVLGSTRYCNAEPAHRRLEIGFTWYAGRAQRTAINTQCKLALLAHAFDTLGAVAVEFRTHWHNHASRAAIARLGARQDGVLRNHRLDPDGARRDTVVFSILDSEWPTVRKALTFRLTRG